MDLERIIKIGGMVYANDLQQAHKPKKSPLIVDDDEEGGGEKKQEWAVIEMQAKPKRKRKGGRR